MSSVRLSPRYGVNPSVTHCFFCQEAAGVALFGMYDGDKEAPRSCMLDMTPCSKCQGFMQQGIIIIEVKDDAEMAKVAEAQEKHKRAVEEFERTKSPFSQRRMLPFIPNPYRSGGWWVVRDDMIRRLVTEPTLRDHILRVRWTFLTQETAQLIGLRNPDGSLLVTEEEKPDGTVRSGEGERADGQEPPAKTD
jgi:hypothetical protein